MALDAKNHPQAYKDSHSSHYFPFMHCSVLVKTACLSKLMLLVHIQARVEFDYFLNKQQTNRSSACFVSV